MLSVVGGRWRRVRGMDPRVLDGVLAVTLSVAAGAQLLAEEPGNVRRLLPVIGTCLPLVLRRRYPIVGHALQIACAVLTQRQPVSLSLLAIFIGVYSVAVYSRWRVPFLLSGLLAGQCASVNSAATCSKNEPCGSNVSAS